MSDTQARASIVTTVLVSYPADLSEWGRWQLEERSFKAYLRRTHDTVAVGDTWTVFLDVGCCGDTYDVPLRIESVEGGTMIGDETTIEYEEREACGLEGGWNVQSAAGPSN